MTSNPPGPHRPPARIVADTGHALILLNTHTGQVNARIGSDRDRWLTANQAPAAIIVTASGASWGTTETPACLLTASPPSARWAWAAAAGIALTLATRTLGPRQAAFARLVALAEAVTRHRPAASVGEAQAAVRAVRWIAQVVPARVACLEESIAALITLAIHRRRADWRHGIATDPIRLHAWIEIHGQPIDEPASTRIYTPLIRVPAEAETGGTR